VAIDAAYRAHGDGLATDGLPGVLYVSPLRALATDVEENLAVPLAGIAAEATRLGLTARTSLLPSAPGTPRRPSVPPCGGRHRTSS